MPLYVYMNLKNMTIFIDPTCRGVLSVKSMMLFIDGCLLKVATFTEDELFSFSSCEPKFLKQNNKGFITDVQI